SVHGNLQQSVTVGSPGPRQLCRGLVGHPVAAQPARASFPQLLPEVSPKKRHPWFVLQADELAWEQRSRTAAERAAPHPPPTGGARGPTGVVTVGPSVGLVGVSRAARRRTPRRRTAPGRRGPRRGRPA